MKFRRSSLSDHHASPGELSFQSLLRRNTWKWGTVLIGVAISGLFLTFVLRGVDPSLVHENLRSADYSLLIMGILLAVLSNIIKAVRWRQLFGQRRPVKVRWLLTSMMIGYLINNVLPGRIGEIGRIYVLSRRAGVPTSTSIATIIVERSVDFLVLLGGVALASITMPLLPAGTERGLTGFLLLCVMALGLMPWGLKRPEITRLAARVADLFPMNTRTTVRGTLESFGLGLTVLGDYWQVALVLMTTFVIWMVEAVSVLFLMRSIRLVLSPVAAFVLVALVSLSFVLPSAPGAIGTYEYFAITALAPFTVDHNQAVAFAVMLHAVTYAVSTAMGLVSLWLESLPIDRSAHRALEWGGQEEAHLVR